MEKLPIQDGGGGGNKSTPYSLHVMETNLAQVQTSTQCDRFSPLRNCCLKLEKTF